eukprot:TRINITY_DN1819_c0_g1_i4.p1 TRINITY_DN1819_c0_g1~~TRINITY_DN1819_c0_g1_i4.p1  ORF type:complete len:219 (-),score=31.91 TRINITY_DN1819_c0_g1_i4:10-666(-)
MEKADQAVLPDLSHFGKADYNTFYEPAEDTYLFLDALKKEGKFLKDVLKPLFCFEIGSGSGCVITYLGQLLGNSALYFTTDINDQACLATQKTSKANKINVESTNTNLLGCLENRLQGKIDLLLFNPPYVPTEPEEVGTPDISAAWAGGDKGREVLDKLLPKLKLAISESGCVYIVAVKENQPEEIMKIMTNFGFCSSVVLERRAFNEHLFILKFQKQ